MLTLSLMLLTFSSTYPKPYIYIHIYIYTYIYIYTHTAHLDSGSYPLSIRRPNCYQRCRFLFNNPHSAFLLSSSPPHRFERQRDCCGRRQMVPGSKPHLRNLVFMFQAIFFGNAAWRKEQKPVQRSPLMELMS
jgi:hypothetical protein